MYRPRSTTMALKSTSIKVRVILLCKGPHPTKCRQSRNSFQSNHKTGNHWDPRKLWSDGQTWEKKCWCDNFQAIFDDLSYSQKYVDFSLYFGHIWTNPGFDKMDSVEMEFFIFRFTHVVFLICHFIHVGCLYLF